MKGCNWNVSRIFFFKSKNSVVAVTESLTVRGLHCALTHMKPYQHTHTQLHWRLLDTSVWVLWSEKDEEACVRLQDCVEFIYCRYFVILVFSVKMLLDCRRELIRLNVSDLKLAEKIILDVSRGSNSCPLRERHCSFPPLHENMSPPANDLWCLIKMCISCFICISSSSYLWVVLHCVWESHPWVQLSSEEEQQLVSLGHAPDLLFHN